MQNSNSIQASWGAHEVEAACSSCAHNEVSRHLQFCSTHSKLRRLLTDRTSIARAMVLKWLWSADLGRHEIRLAIIEKKRKDYVFQRQFIEKPSILPGCPVARHHTSPYL